MKRRSLFTWIILALLALVLAGGGWWLWRARTTSSAAANTVRVQRGTIEASVDALGKVQPARQMALSLRLNGVVQQLPVAVGQRVGKGALLLEVETGEVQEAIAQAERSLSVRRMQLDEALQAPDAPTLDLARARLRRATAARLAAQDKYDKVASKPNAEKSDEAVTLETAKLEYEVAQAEYDRIMQGPTPLQLARLRADVQEGELTLRQARARLEQARIVAPFAGTVMSIAPQPGENVYAYNPLLRLADLERLEIIAAIDELDIPAVAEGQRVQIRLDAFAAQPFAGRVARVAPGATEVRGTTAYEAIIAFERSTLPPTLGLIRPGMGANLTIITRAAEGVLLVPKTAIRQAGRYQVVRVLNNGAPQEVVVRTGLSNASEVEVVEGLSEGQVVLLN